MVANCAHVSADGTGCRRLLFAVAIIAMSAANYAKQAGLSSLKEVIERTGQSRQTLQNWYEDKPALFEVVIAGCVALKQPTHATSTKEPTD